MGWKITPVRQSAKARLLSRMLHDFCKEGVLITVTVMTKLLRNANMARDPLTVTSIKEGNSVLKWYKDNYLLSNPENLNAIGIKLKNVMKINRLTLRSVIKQLRQRIISSYWV